MKYFFILSSLFYISLQAMDNNINKNIEEFPRGRSKSYFAKLEKTKSMRHIPYNKDKAEGVIFNDEENNNGNNNSSATIKNANRIKAATIRLVKTTKSLLPDFSNNNSQSSPNAEINRKKIDVGDENWNKVQEELKNKFGNK